MTEHEAFLLHTNGTSALLMDALQPELPTDTPARAHVDATRGMFITSKGKEIELSGQAISSLMLERLTNEGKPKIPMIEVTLLGKHKQMQANPNEPGYLALLKEWEGDVNVKTLRYIFVIGAKGQPPQEFVDVQAQFFPEASDLEMKYLWVSSLLPDEDIDVFTEAVLGRTTATTKGVESAANFSE